ncbi:MAG: Fic family protein [Sporichthyaceae bacterium]
MDLARFQDSPAGRLHAIRIHDSRTDRSIDHAAFVPYPLPSAVSLAPSTYKLIAEAHEAIGRLDSAAGRLPDPRLLVRPALRAEAHGTAALEGTHAPLAEVLEGDYVDPAQRSPEVREVLNYVTAAERGLELIRTKPICVTVVAELQALIVAGTRGESYDAGRLRDRQVVIGDQGRGLAGARYVPPPHGPILVEGMSDWGKWINAEDDLPLVLKCALAHYQFEALHPFSDGNGRVGRLIITLQLVDAGALTFPLLNLSPWLERRKQEYKDLLLEVSTTGDFDSWVQFFCRAVRAQADDMVGRVDDLWAVREDLMAQVRAAKGRGVIVDIAADLIGYPVITVTEAARLYGVTYPPANNAMRKLVELGILREVTGERYGRIYVCPRVMEVMQRESK